MKKLLSTIFFATFLLCYFATPLYAQETPKETTDIREIKVRYCNDPLDTDAKSLFIDAKIDEKSVICIDFINTANKKANIGINFVDGAITDDADQKKSCLSEGEKKNFWQYTSNYPNTLEIAPNSAKRVFVDLLYSGGFAGTSYGCLTYHALDQTDNQNINGSMFNIFSRVGSFIDAFVVGDFKIQLMTTPILSDFYENIGDNPNLIIYNEWSWKEWIWKSSFWNYKAKVDIINTGNIAVTGDVQITWKNLFIIKDTTTINDQIFLPKQTRSFEIDLPWYVVRFLWGNMEVSAHVEYEAIYLGSYAQVAPKEVFTLVDSANVLFFPWIVLFLIIYIAWRLIHNNDHKIHRTKKTTWSVKQLFTKIPIKNPSAKKIPQKIIPRKTPTRRPKS